MSIKQLHLTMGFYLCHQAGDWPQGLVHLAKCSDEKLREVATLDLSTPTKVEQQLELANRWLNYARETSPYSWRFADRARYWLLLAAKQNPADQNAAIKAQLKQAFKLSSNHDPVLRLLEILTPIRRHGLFSKFQVEGYGTSANHEILPAEPSFLVGFDIQLRPLSADQRHPSSDGIEYHRDFGIYNAVFLNAAGIDEPYPYRGTIDGIEHVSIRARKGWAVAGFRHSDSSKFQGFAVLFRKVTYAGLDRDRAYWSESYFAHRITPVYTNRNTTLVDTLNLPIIGINGEIENPPLQPPKYQEIRYLGLQIVNKDALPR